MKKIILILFMVLFTQMFSLADDRADVKAFFDSFVKATNTYSKDIPNYYLTDARIVRVVLKKDGTKKPVNFEMKEYKEYMAKSEKIAKVVKYKNTYKNVSISKYGEDYKISAVRYPNQDTKGLACYFIVTKTPSGYKIKVESMETPVQDFLKRAK